MKNNWIGTIIIVIVVAAAAFFGGMKYQQTQAVTNSNGNQYMQNGLNQGGQNGRFRGRGGIGRGAVGEIISQDANSVTIKLQDGSSKIVNITGSTTYSKTATASKSDLQTGTRIAVFGTNNSDGSITAQNVQINPMMRGGFGSPRPTQ